MLRERARAVEQVVEIEIAGAVRRHEIEAVRALLVAAYRLPACGFVHLEEACRALHRPGTIPCDRLGGARQRVGLIDAHRVDPRRHIQPVQPLRVAQRHQCLPELLCPRAAPQRQPGVAGAQRHQPGAPPGLHGLPAWIGQ
jgi:hypothetical protein